MSLIYQPPPTVERFMLSDARFRFITGPVGSGKSMGMIMELLRRARQQRPDSNGVRNTRFALVRNTLAQLRTTVLPDVQQYLNPMVRYFVTDATIQVRAPLEDNTTINSDWIMIPLETREDIRRLLSMQLTGAWLNELREIEYEVVSGLMERIGRYPSKINGGPTWHGLIADSNPGTTDSPYYEHFILNPVPGWEIFQQPSGLSPYAENLENLPANYYENAMSGASEDRIATQIRSEWGTSNAGQAVFRSSFRPDVHVRDMVTVINPHRPVMIGMDFGRTPCALIGQVDFLGRLLVFEEVTSEDMGLRQFVNEQLKPRLFVEPYLGKRSFVVGDPAGAYKSQLAEENAFDVLKSAGFAAYPAVTNDIPPRLLAFEKLLSAFPGGEPAIQISRQGCPTLVRALASQYRYRKKRDGQLEDKPEKLHPWSDVADAGQYMALAVNADVTSRVLARMRPKPVVKKFTSAAWT
jgi:hypothetical protein